MPPIEVGASRAIGAVSPEIARKTGTEASTAGAFQASTAATVNTNATAAKANVAAQSAVDASKALSTSDAPVDTDRVAEVRKAVETGTYPLVPAKIADAMIAAGMFLRSAKA